MYTSILALYITLLIFTVTTTCGFILYFIFKDDRSILAIFLSLMLSVVNWIMIYRVITIITEMSK